MHSRITLAAVAILGLLTITACEAGTAPGPAASSPAPTPTHPQVTKAEAETHLAAYVALNNKANAKFDEKLLAQYETGASLVIDKAHYRAVKSAKKTPPGFKPFDLRDAEYFPVRSTAYPRVFLTRGHQRNLDGTKSQSGWKYQLFRQETEGGPWLQFFSPVGEIKDSEPQPEVATDAEGLATEVPLDASELLIPPSKFAANYTARLLGKPLPEKNVQFVGVDTWTSSQAAYRKKLKQFAKVIERAAPSTEHLSYALRTKDGGALVFATISYKIRLDPHKNSWVTDTSGTGFLKQNTPYRGFMEMNYLLNLLAYVPPAGGSKIRMIGSYSGMTSASGA